MPEKVTLIVPAFNEEKYIEGVLQPLVEWRNEDRKNRDLVVVNDGSTDGTAEIARRMGARVIDSNPGKPGNYGKGEAFLAGIRHARKNKADILFTIDADFVGVKPPQIDAMIRELREKKRNMIIGRQLAPNLKGQLMFFSGVRAIRMKALNPFVGKYTTIGKKRVWSPAYYAIREMIKGYGLEPTLNYFIRNDFSSEVFNSAPIMRKGLPIGLDQANTKAIIRKRKNVADEVRKRLKPPFKTTAWMILDSYRGKHGFRKRRRPR